MSYSTSKEIISAIGKLMLAILTAKFNEKLQQNFFNYNIDFHNIQCPDTDVFVQQIWL